VESDIIISIEQAIGEIKRFEEVNAKIKRPKLPPWSGDPHSQ
jgi:hypothetical protein